MADIPGVKSQEEPSVMVVTIICDYPNNSVVQMARKIERLP